MYVLFFLAYYSKYVLKLYIRTSLNLLEFDKYTSSTLSKVGISNSSTLSKVRILNLLSTHLGYYFLSSLARFLTFCFE